MRKLFEKEILLNDKNTKRALHKLIPMFLIRNVDYIGEFASSLFIIVQ